MNQINRRSLARKILCVVSVAAAVTMSASAGAANPETPKPAYMIAEFQLSDAAAIKPYRDKVEATFKPYSGRFLVRGGATDSKEGEAVRGHVVVTRFDSMELAKAWYTSAAYQEILPIRVGAGESRVYFVEGLAE